MEAVMMVFVMALVIKSILMEMASSCVAVVVMIMIKYAYSFDGKRAKSMCRGVGGGWVGV